VPLALRREWDKVAPNSGECHPPTHHLSIRCLPTEQYGLVLIDAGRQVGRVAWLTRSESEA